MRVQSKPRQADPAPGVQLQAWAAAVASLRPDRDRAEFEARRAEIASGLRNLATQLRLTR